MAVSENAPRHPPGRTVPTKLEDFSPKCQLDLASKHIVVRLNRLVVRQFGSYAGLARHLADLDIDPPPTWAHLDKKTRRQTGSASTRVGLLFGRSAAVSPFWPEIMLILHHCRALENAAEIASFWTASKGIEPLGYTGELVDVSSFLTEPDLASEAVRQPPATGPSPADTTTVETLRQIIENGSIQNGRLAAENERLARRLQALENELRQIDALVEEQREQLSKGLASGGTLAPARPHSGSITQRIKHNSRLTGIALSRASALGANRMREVYGDRAHSAEKNASELLDTIRIEREITEQSAHVFATFITLATRPGVLDSWYIPEQIDKLSLPREVRRLFEPLKLPRRERSNRTLSTYLRAFLVSSHGTNPAFEVDPGDELRRLIDTGILPSPAVVSSFFGTTKDAERLRALLQLTEADHVDVQREFSFISKSAKRHWHKDQDPDPTPESAKTMILPVWRSTA